MSSLSDVEKYTELDEVTEQQLTSNIYYKSTSKRVRFYLKYISGTGFTKSLHAGWNTINSGNAIQNTSKGYFFLYCQQGTGKCYQGRFEEGLIKLYTPDAYDGEIYFDQQEFDVNG